MPIHSNRSDRKSHTGLRRRRIREESQKVTPNREGDMDRLSRPHFSLLRKWGLDNQSISPSQLRVNCQNPDSNSTQELSNNKTFVKPNVERKPLAELGGLGQGEGMP